MLAAMKPGSVVVDLAAEVRFILAISLVHF